MKRKGPKSIPDFSTKRNSVQKPGTPAEKSVSPPVPRPPVIKPQATSAKSGRRGT